MPELLQLTDQALAVGLLRASLMKIVFTEFVVGFASLQDVVSDHQYGVAHRYGGLLGAAPTFQAGVAGREIAAFGVSGGMRRPD